MSIITYYLTSNVFGYNFYLWLLRQIQVSSDGAKALPFDYYLLILLLYW